MYAEAIFLDGIHCTALTRRSVTACQFLRFFQAA